MQSISLIFYFFLISSWTCRGHVMSAWRWKYSKVPQVWGRSGLATLLHLHHLQLVFFFLLAKIPHLWSFRKTLKWTKRSSVCIHLPVTRQFKMLQRLQIAAKLNGSTAGGTDRSDVDASDVPPSHCLINWFWQHSTPRLVFLCWCRNLWGVSSKTRLNCRHISHLWRAVSDRHENKVGISFKHRR